MENRNYCRNSRYVFTGFLLASLAIYSAEGLAAKSMWQGPYVGAYLGRAYGNMHTSTDTGSPSDVAAYFTNQANIFAVNAAGTSSGNVQSAIAGVQAGHDWIHKQVVYGIVFDYGKLPLNTSSNVTNTYPDNSGQYTIYTSMTTNWLFTLRGRIGYVFPDRCPASLFYLTTGPALTQIKVSNNFNDNTAGAGNGSNQTFQIKFGWTFGAGFEVSVYKHVFLNFEYLYLQMPSVKNTAYITNTQGGFGIDPQSTRSRFSTTGRMRANLLKIALNYKFSE